MIKKSDCFQNMFRYKVKINEDDYEKLLKTRVVNKVKIIWKIKIIPILNLHQIFVHILMNTISALEKINKFEHH